MTSRVSGDSGLRGVSAEKMSLSQTPSPEDYVNAPDIYSQIIKSRGSTEPSALPTDIGKFTRLFENVLLLALQSKTSINRNLLYIIRAQIKTTSPCIMALAVQTLKTMSLCYEKNQALEVISKAYARKGNREKAIEIAKSLPTSWQDRLLTEIVEIQVQNQDIDSATETVQQIIDLYWKQQADRIISTYRQTSKL
ncbi:MAG: hypothetical protein SP4CHLAM5_11980 [Chlamydiia bacterium]|nr:hypothetical protein [Chlamydiia bacterium]MCH9619052.1 hypothetical protein [Chlamydiia bacterium]MCH9623728.1 hypothetical protein [Chlamydiia bacterium]